MSETNPDLPVPRVRAKLITCVVPDDGTDKRVLEALREEFGIARASSVHCRGFAALSGSAKNR